MGVYQIGEVIRRTRESLSITQQELSDGICSVRTLSRIETGKNMPNRATFEALMERMGKDGERYLPFIRSEEIQDHVKREEIERLVHVQNYKKVDQILMELENSLNPQESINRQYILGIRAITDYELGRIDEKEERRQLVEALRCTIAEYKEGTIPDKFFSRRETLILCNIAATYFEGKEFQKCVDLLRKLQEYFETVSIDRKEKTKTERLVLSNLTQALWYNGEKEQSLKSLKKAIPLAIEGDNAGSLGYLLYDLAYGEHELQRNESCCKERLLEAYYVAESCNNTGLIELIRAYVQKNYDDSFLKHFISFPDDVLYKE